MNTAGERKTYLQSLLDGLEKRAGEPDWLFEIRENAFKSFQAGGFPTRKQEAWKTIYLESLLQSAWRSEAVETRGGNIASSSFGAALNDENRLIFINGMYQSDRSLTSKAFQSVLATKLDDQSAWVKPMLASMIALETNPFVLINTFQFRGGVFLRIPPNTSMDKPLHLIFASEGELQVSYPRILVDLGENSKVNIVLHLQGSISGRSFMNSAVQFLIEKNAEVSCTVRQQESPSAVQFLNLRARMAEGSRFTLVNYAAGGAMIRNESTLDLEGEHTFASASGLSVMTGNSQFFQHVKMNHKAPHCTSRQVYKNILADKSVAEFNSLAHVWRDAKKSDSQQLNKNLLLSETARVYSRPQLKIDNDDVSANHGAATGPLDPKLLFYLLSRGIPLDQARALLIYGFSEQVLESVIPVWLRREMETDMESRVRDILVRERAWK